MHANKMRLVLIAAVILLIIVALGVGGLLNITAFKRNYTESLATSYQIVALSPKRNIEYAVRYGKSITQFSGIEGLLQKIIEDIPEAKDVRIVLPDGQVIYDVNGVVKHKTLPVELMKKNDFALRKSQMNSEIIPSEGEYHVFVPLTGKDGNWLASIDIVIPEAVIDANVGKYAWRVFQSTVVIGIISLNMLVFLLFAIPIMGVGGQIKEKRFIAIVVLIFVLAQGAYGIFNINLFHEAYVATSEKNMTVLLRCIAYDVERVVDKGVPYNRLVGLDNYLDHLAAGNAEIASIQVVGEEQQVLYKTSTKEVVAGDAAAYRYSRDIMKDKAGIAGKIQVWLSPSYIQAKTQNIILVVVSVAVGFILLVIALARFLPQIISWLEHKIAKATRKARPVGEVK